MAKNMTRRAIALGAAGSLVSALFAGVPAYAATTVTLSPLAGTETNTVLGGTFLMKATATDTSSTRVRFLVEGANPTELVAKGAFSTSATTTGLINDKVVGSRVTNVTLDETDLTSGADKATLVSVTAADDGTWDDGKQFFLDLSLDTAEVTADRSITVTPFIDNSFFNDGITTGEASFASTTVNFLKASGVTATTALKPVITGTSKTLVAVTTLEPAINEASTAFPSGTTGLQTYFTEDGNSFGGGKTDAVYSAADGGYKATSTSVTLAVDKVYGAQSYLLDAKSGSNDLSSGAKSLATGRTATMVVDPSESYQLVYDSSDDVIRTETGSFSLNATLTFPPGKSKAGVPVTFVITEGATAGQLMEIGTASVSAGGSTLTNTSNSTGLTAEKITATALTNAKGVATLDVSYAGIKANDQFTIDASAPGATATLSFTQKTFTGEDSKAARLVPAIYGGEDNDGAVGDKPVVPVVAGANGSISYKLVDQFGQTPAGTFRANFSMDDGNATVTDTEPVSSGSVTFNFTNNADGAANRTVTTTVNKLGSDGVTWGGSLSLDSNIPVEVRSLAAAQTAPARISASMEDSNVNDLALDSKHGSVDTRLTVSSAVEPANFGETYLTGTVYGTDGSVLQGVDVTASAPSTLFTVDGSDAAGDSYRVHGYESITVKTDEGGGFKLLVDSNMSGKRDITLTAGSATEVLEDVEFAAAGEETGDSWDITAPSSVEPGSTFTVSAVLKDAFGNPVYTDLANDGEDDVTVTYTGPGLVVGSLPTDTNALGVASFSVLLGSNDSGSITVVFSEDGVAEGATDTYDDIVASVSITIGETVGDYGTQKAWTVNQDDGTAKVYVKFPEVGGKLRILHQTGGSGSYDSIYSKTTTSETMDGLRIVEGVGTYVVRTIDLADGTNRIRVSVDGEDIEVNGKDRPARYNE